MPRERAAPLRLDPSLFTEKGLSVEPQPWPGDKALRHLALDLAEESPFVFESTVEADPLAAGPAVMELPAAEWPTESTLEPDHSWTTPAVRLPEASRSTLPGGSFVLCSARPGLLADAVEAFLPPNREPEMLAYSALPAVRLYWGLQPIDWNVSAELANPVPAPAADAVESLLPQFAEPQMAAWPTAAVLPQLKMAGADCLAATEMADAVAGPAAEAVESLLPQFAEPQMAAWPTAAVPPQLTLAAADWVVESEMAEPVAGPAAEVVESLLPQFAEPQMAAWPTAAVLPQLTLDAADWVVEPEMAEPVDGAAADAVERLLPQFAEPQMAAWPAAAGLPQVTLDGADWLAATEMAEAVASPAAEAVERLLPQFAEPEVVAWPAAAVLPQLTLAAADWVVESEMAEPVAGPAADAVESLLPRPAEPEVVAWPAAAAALPRLWLDPAAWALPVDLAEPVAAPGPQAVETLLPANPEPQVASWLAAAARLPQLTLEAVEWELTAELAERVDGPAAAAVESLLPAPAEPVALPMFTGALRLPELALAAAEQEPLEEFVPPLVIADACQDWMPSPPTCEAAREVTPMFGGAMAPGADLRVAASAGLELAQPMIRWEGDWRPSALAEPVISFVAPHVEPAIAAHLSISALPAGVLRSVVAQHAQNIAAPAAERYPEAAEPSPVDSQVLADQSGVRTPILQFPSFAVEHATGSRAAAFRPSAPQVVEPAASEPSLATGASQPDGAAAVVSPAAPAAMLRCGLPLAKAATSDFICHRTSMAPVISLRPMAPGISVTAPKFVVRPIFERIEEAVTPSPKPAEKTPAFAEVFAISKAARKTSAIRAGQSSAAKLIAASLIVGIGMWFGAGSVKISRQIFAINSRLHGIGATNTSSGMDTTSTAPSGGFPSPKYSAAKSEGPIAKVRHAIQNRAALELTDTFRRMEAWGSSAMTMPAGWTRHPDGYVQTGQLALYRPTQSFADYHFEFFGGIEKKGMSWAVRASNPENYYGMKMTVIEPGLRPVVAMVHYAVVAGKKMQRVETPLSIMVHNNEPYHIAVDVKGNRVVTSIEGQEVDSWTDDSLKAGGVGFFSEVGESARLYWMRVSRNQDWLGRVCAYLSSGSGSNTADLWREQMPQAPSQPSEPAPPPAAEVAWVTAEETGEFSEMGPQRARILKYGRTELCRS